MKLDDLPLPSRATVFEIACKLPGFGLETLRAIRKLIFDRTGLDFEELT
jgi:hypothetical protein